MRETEQERQKRLSMERSKKDLQELIKEKREKEAKKQQKKEQIIQEMRKVLNDSSYVLVKREDYIYLNRCRATLLDLIGTLKTHEDVYNVLVKTITKLVEEK